MSDGNVWHFFCSIWFVVLAMNDKLKKNDT